MSKKNSLSNKPDISMCKENDFDIHLIQLGAVKISGCLHKNFQFTQNSSLFTEKTYTTLVIKSHRNAFILTDFEVFQSLDQHHLTPYLNLDHIGPRIDYISPKIDHLGLKLSAPTLSHTT